jgi:hypothetical protein
MDLCGTFNIQTIAVLKIWNYPQYQMNEENVVYNILGYCSAFKWKKICDSMDGIEDIMLSEVCPAQKDKHCMISLIS